MINGIQLVVRMDKTTIEWLERQGYKNPSELPNNSANCRITVIDLTLL